nr:lanthionine synthetase LanC family protein [Bacillus licheniformis]
MHGAMAAAGILLSRSILRENGVNDPGPHTDILNALETTVKHGFGNNRSFCHGDFGQLEILRGFREEFSELNTIIQNTEDRLLTYFQENPFSKGVSRGVDSAGLMLGLSGVGYGMLAMPIWRRTAGTASAQSASSAYQKEQQSF